MSKMEKLLNEAEQYAADFEKFVAKAGPDYPKQRVIGLLREMSDALRQHATALEIGRGIGREEAAKVCEKFAGSYAKAAKEDDRGNENYRGRCKEAGEVLSFIASAIRAASLALDVEALVERVFKTIVASEVVDEINPAYVDQFWEDRNGVHSGDCTKQAHTCLRCRAEAHEQLARAVIASLGVGE